MSGRPSLNSRDRWVLQEHSQVKHDLLRKYLIAWARIVGRSFPTVVFIDGFAGRGQYEDGEPGSPLIALQVAEEAKLKHMDAHFIEQDPENAADLRRVVALETAGGKRFHACVHEGPFEEKAPVIVASIGPRVPCFVFIDPWGFKGVPFDLVKSIMQRPYAEIFLTFMSRDMGRFLTSKSHERRLDEIMGTSSWRNLVAQGLRRENLQAALAALYRRQLHESARVKYTWAYRVSMPTQRRTVYYLVYATNHYLGLEIMKNVMYTKGGLSYTYWGPEELVRQGQMSLFDVEENEPAWLGRALHQRFAGKSLSYYEIKERTWESRYVDKHYRAAIKWLEAQSLVTVERRESKRTGIKNRDVVHFKRDRSP